jgi:dipeptidase E
MKHPENKKNEGIPQNANLILMGGGIYVGTARPMLEFGVNLANKPEPTVLLIATPKIDKKIFNETVKNATELFQNMGAAVCLLHEFETMPSDTEISEKIDSSDVIYITGGSTVHALEQWRRYGVDAKLSDAMRQGKIITGMSAGAIPWFAEGLTDSAHYDPQADEEWDFGTIEGINHIDTFVTPHFDSMKTPDSQKRSIHFASALVRKSQETGRPEFGLGMDNNAGLLAVDGLVRIITTRATSTLHVVRAEPSGEFTITDLKAPTVQVSEGHTSISQIGDEGISWEDFYAQLSEPTRSPQVVASVSSKVS